MKRLVLAVLLLPTLAWAQMYKCVDERGVTHYADKPRPGCKGGQVDIRPSPPLSGQAPAPAARRPSDVAGQDAEFKRRQIEREQAEVKEKQVLAQRCARLRYEHGVLASGTRIFKTNEVGERVYLEDASRDARLAQLKEEMRGCP